LDRKRRFLPPPALPALPVTAGKRERRCSITNRKSANLRTKGAEPGARFVLAINNWQLAFGPWDKLPSPRFSLNPFVVVDRSRRTPERKRSGSNFAGGSL
jgi:hypothetical protein